MLRLHHQQPVNSVTLNDHHLTVKYFRATESI